MVSKLSLVHVICVEGLGGGHNKTIYRLACKKKDRVKKVVKATKARSFTFLSFTHLY